MVAAGDRIVNIEFTELSVREQQRRSATRVPGLVVQSSVIRPPNESRQSYESDRNSVAIVNYNESLAEFSIVWTYTASK